MRAAFLAEAGFVDISDRGLVAVHPAPLGHVPRAWLVPHVLRGLEMVDGDLDAGDVAALRRFAEQVPQRGDLFVHAARRVLVARRP